LHDFPVVGRKSDVSMAWTKHSNLRKGKKLDESQFTLANFLKIPQIAGLLIWFVSD